MEDTKSPQMNGTPQEPTSAVEFTQNSIHDYLQQGNTINLIIMSKDVLKDIYKEMKVKGMLPKPVPPFSVALMLNSPIKVAGYEVVLCGGQKRFALI